MSAAISRRLTGSDPPCPARAANSAARPAPHPSRNLRRRIRSFPLATVAGLLRLRTPETTGRTGRARVVELADAQVLGTCAERREGSSPSSRIPIFPIRLRESPSDGGSRLGKNLVRILTTHCGGIARKGWPHGRAPEAKR